MKFFDVHKQIHATHIDAIKFAWTCNKFIGSLCAISSLPTLIVSGLFRAFASTGWQQSSEEVKFNKRQRLDARNFFNQENIKTSERMRAGLRAYNFTATSTFSIGMKSNIVTAGFAGILSLSFLLTLLAELPLFLACVKISDDTRNFLTGQNELAETGDYVLVS